MESPIATDPNVLEKLYQRFDYLQDLPCELRGCFIDDATSLGNLETEGFLGFLMAYKMEEESPSKDHFLFLNSEQNLQIRYCRHISPVQLWPQPVVGVAFDPVTDTGHTTGTHRVNVMMRSIGNAQLWWGGEVGVIWEAFFDRCIQSNVDHEELMHQLWSRCEDYLAGQGVKQVFTYDRDPALEEGWYRRFLTQRGYQVLETHRAVVKTLELLEGKA